MTVPFKPESYASVSPYLVVDGAARTIDFLQQVFGAERLRCYDRPDGTIMHGEVRIDDTVLMLADGTPQWPSVPAHVHIYVPDVDDTWAKALAAGAEAVREPVKGDDADKRGGFKDAGGTTWWVATQVE